MKSKPEIRKAIQDQGYGGGVNTNINQTINNEATSNTGLDLDELNHGRQCILIVEDEPDTIFLLKQILLNSGFNVRSAMSGKEAIEKVKLHKPDLVLLDLMMPEMDGWDTFRYLRQVADVPVIILSALAIKEDIVKALQLGVDDYITKPFYNAEVVARVKAVLRRSGKEDANHEFIIREAGIFVDLAEQVVRIDDKKIELSPREFSVFLILARNAPAVVKYSQITQEVWGEDSASARKRTKFLIYLIRKKLEDVCPTRELIVNLDRIGYKLQLIIE